MPENPHDTDPATPATPASRDELVDAEHGGAEHGEAASAPRAEHEEAVIASEQRVRVRRTPRYGRFMLLGGGVLAIAAFIVTYSLPQGQGYDRNTVFGFVLLIAVSVGVALGALAAILAAAVTKRTERTVVADRIDVHVEPASDPDGSAVSRPDLGELPSEVEHPAGAEHPAGTEANDPVDTDGSHDPRDPQS